ncbi:MAG TPA: hypothetical protein VK174_07675 [Chitinophagales bacterium]|nr:hypothetical protein [Chitinophagales bacterium]
MQNALLTVIILLLFVCTTTAQKVGTSNLKIMSLDSLSDEDLALLEEYRDSFLIEVQQIKEALGYKKRRPVDSTVAVMNRSSHVEIGLNVSGPVLSNGRKTGLKGAVFAPGMMYYHKTGLYLALGMSFFTDSAMRVSARVPSMYISPGFSRTFFKRWNFSIGYTRNFIFYGADVKIQNYTFPAADFQRGLLNNSISVYNSYDFWQYLTVGISAAVCWSSNLYSKKYTTGPLGRKLYYKDLTKKGGQAYTASIGLSLRKDFSFYNILGAKVFTVTPDIYFLFGRDNSTLITRAVRRPGLTIDADDFFGFLDVEPGLALTWRIRNLEISGSFHCAIPFNEYDSSSGKRIKNPKEYYPYGEGGIKYLFRISRKSPKKIKT